MPFCHTKCGYCDFYSLPTRPELIEGLVEAIRREIRQRDPGRPVRSIFVGGGTPTVLPPNALEAVLSAIPKGHDGRSFEFTVEANPSSADELKLELLRRGGANRISFGAQSFHADDLAALERLHDPAQIPEAVRLARTAGFGNVNIDLIFGVPGQTTARWLDSLRRAIDLGVEHISCYALTYEEGTSLTKRLRAGRVTPIDEEVDAAMFEQTIDVLTDAGFEHYEISNFARPGRRCEHNLIYWRNEEYVGVGPSAVSYVDGVRRKNVPDVKRYIDAVLHGADGLVFETEQLDAEARACETAIQWLRLLDGIEIGEFHRATGFDPLALFHDAIERFVSSGHLEVAADQVRLTRRGLPVANVVMREFLAGDGEPDRAGSPFTTVSLHVSPS
ncbi:MAG: radical SAM family heme chaperone HemW [Phycisphaerae bacterium]